MMFDRETMTILIGEDGDVIPGIVAFLLNLEKEMAEKHKVPSYVESWKNLQQWLGTEGRELTEEEYKKVTIAYKAYCMFGNSSSVERKAAFFDARFCEGISIDDLPPPAIQKAFHKWCNRLQEESAKKTEQRGKQIITEAWKANKTFRAYSFASGLWMVLVLTYVLLFDPYHSSFFNHSEEEIIHMAMVILIPPILVCAARTIYDQYIK